MPRTSAGLLPYRHTADGLEVLVGHMGGPFWARKDAGAWSIVKGEVEPGETDLEAVARREVAEELGVPAPPGPWLDLGQVRQSGGKVVQAYAVAAPDLALVSCTEVEMEWPRGSGRVIRFPELDRAEWLTLPAARERLVAGQRPLLDLLQDRLGQGPQA
ncbi:NUDIX domain-containing protein [Arsenicicoccus dermatophilus]|uniref:NUDIX domain-containing protein n=1 Tax=Arsenicicoccus dermatophilus TaxID=1076331 RepID=UPI001F4C5EB1|nr:NUDIX domain-containing protein [Arsenicicoccus dermatophilus]MCH8614210.1 NUDIX domain-containing protein [Arsenicicoccus dermatophilus]